MSGFEKFVKRYPAIAMGWDEMTFAFHIYNLGDLVKWSKEHGEYLSKDDLKKLGGGGGRP